MPEYDRAALAPSVVHIGVGAFHRAHQAVYFDDLARQGERGWGLTGVGLRSRHTHDVLAGQDHLYLVVERQARRDVARLVGVMGDSLFGPEDPEAVLAVLADERTRLVTLTITDSAYCIDPRTGLFAPDEEVLADLLREGQPPRSVFGYLVEALARRRRRGLKPFTVLSCDNLQDNGGAARTAVMSAARLRDPHLADWIAARVAFPRSMVDRITPQTTAEERNAIADRYGVRDRCPVVTEPFRQWIVEDWFCNGRPPLERVGVRFVADVAPYAQMKTRLLNAAHCSLGYLGYLGGHRTMNEVLADPTFREYLVAMMSREIVPHLPPVPDVDLAKYQSSLVERLTNPRLTDQLARLRRRGGSKVAHHLVPSIRAAMERGDRPQLLCLAVAAWATFPPDREDVDLDALLSDPLTFGELAGDPCFSRLVEAQVAALRDGGVRGAITRCLDLHEEASR
jgi:fructuronate reductase/mannitol 2-dehydrogenase